MAKQVVNDFSKGSIISNILRLSIPMTLAQLINVLYSIVDRIYIGRMGENSSLALTGVGVCLPIITIVIAFANLIGMGGAPLFSIKRGEGNEKEAEAILGNSVTLLVIFGLCLTVVGLIVKRPLLYLLGASENTIEYANSYITIYLLGNVFVMMSLGLNSFINAQGRPGISMIAVIIGAILNIGLDPLFIYVFGMGVTGAALATVISQAVSAFIIVGFLVSDKATLKIKPKYLKPDIKIISSLFALGIAPFIMASTESLVGFVLNGSLSAYGDIYVSTLTVMQSAMQFAAVPLSGFAQGFVPIVSYNYGKGNTDRVRLCFKYSVIIMFSFFALSNLFMITFPEFVAGMFTDDTALIETVGRMMPLFLTGMTIFGLQRTCQNMFVALGQAKISLFIALLRKVILLIPLALILPNFLGVKGVYLAESVADATSAICCTVIFALTFRKILKKREQT